MSGVEVFTVTAADGEVRLDRWFRRHYPGLSQIRLQKLLRTGQVRVDGRRARHNDRVTPGQTIRVPPLDEVALAPRQTASEAAARPLTEAEIRQTRAMVLHQDELVIALNKPAGLAVQGGTGTSRHVDRLLDALAHPLHGRPRLVHRLDRDTSGVLLVARTAAAAAALSRLFRLHSGVRKEYWALTVGTPDPVEGTIRLPLAKRLSGGEEKVVADPEEGRLALTDYTVADRAGRTIAFVRARPVTGRTHQIRVHLAAIGCPILGDRKYGGPEAMPSLEGVANRLHLHARRLILAHPGGGTLDVSAPLPDFMAASWRAYGFDVPRRLPDFGPGAEGWP